MACGGKPVTLFHITHQRVWVVFVSFSFFFFFFFFFSLVLTLAQAHEEACRKRMLVPFSS